jgi:nicotinamide phosphoribosyltransferase
MGGKLLQSDIDRDVNNFATKACYAVVDGKERNIAKSPIEIDENFNENPSFKKSKSGQMKLVKAADGTFFTLTSHDEGYSEAKDELVPVFENGKILVEYTFEEIRERASITNE